MAEVIMADGEPGSDLATGADQRRPAPRWAPGSTVLRCVDDRRADVACSGTVELRESLTGTGTPIARCSGHWSLRQAYQREHDQRFPDRAPADFDESYAGESWDEPD